MKTPKEFEYEIVVRRTVNVRLTIYASSEEEAKQALTAFSVRSDVNKANSRMREMRLMGVPAIVVDGRYVVSPQTAGSLENMPRIADALVEKVRNERAQ